MSRLMSDWSQQSSLQFSYTLGKHGLTLIGVWCSAHASSLLIAGDLC